MERTLCSWLRIDIEFQRAEWKGRMAEKVRHRAVRASGDDRYSGLWSVLGLVL